MSIKETTSRDTTVVDRVTGSKGHSKVHICDTVRNIHVTRLGRTPEEARERAWDEYGDKRSDSGGSGGK